MSRRRRNQLGLTFHLTSIEISNLSTLTIGSVILWPSSVHVDLIQPVVDAVVVVARSWSLIWVPV